MVSKRLLLSLVVVGIAAFLYQYFSALDNDPKLLNDIKVISSHPSVEKHLTRFRDVIDKDYEGYRGHIYRVLTYSIHFLHGNEDKIHVIAAALVFHDLGLWTDGTLAYLEPSVNRAEEYFDKKTFSKEDRQLVKDIIYWHHKITPFDGPNSEVVNAVIKGDLIDASSGLFTRGMPRSHIQTVNNAIPEAGFHQTLAEFGPRLHGWNVVRIVMDMSSLLKW
jgi:hypothetical protein